MYFCEAQRWARRTIIGLFELASGFLNVVMLTEPEPRQLQRVGGKARVAVGPLGFPCLLPSALNWFFLVRLRRAGILITY